MCIIVDADVASLVFAESPHEDFLPVFRWLHEPKKHGRVVHGGRLTRELFKVGRARRYLLRLQQAGKARLIPDREVRPEEERVAQTGLCKSDDPHVIALARISGARTLCSHNKHLHVDFKNRKLISDPRGSVYQTTAQEHLLRHTPSCGYR